MYYWYSMLVWLSDVSRGVMVAVINWTPVSAPVYLSVKALSYGSQLLSDHMALPACQHVYSLKWRSYAWPQTHGQEQRCQRAESRMKMWCVYI